MEPGESVIFQPVLQACPTRHSWIITTHVSLANLEHHWKLFNRQLTRTQQFLRSLDQHPSEPTQLLTALQLELSNIQDIYGTGTEKGLGKKMMSLTLSVIFGIFSVDAGGCADKLWQFHCTVVFPPKD